MFWIGCLCKLLYVTLKFILTHCADKGNGEEPFVYFATIHWTETGGSI